MNVYTVRIIGAAGIYEWDIKASKVSTAASRALWCYAKEYGEYKLKSCIIRVDFKEKVTVEAKDTSVVTEKTERSTAMDSDIARAMKEMGCVETENHGDKNE